MIGFRNRSIVLTPALLVMVPSFLELFHLQQPKEGVSKCPISVSHISNDEPLYVLSPRRQQEADQVPYRTVQYLLHCVAGREAQRSTAWPDRTTRPA